MYGCDLIMQSIVDRITHLRLKLICTAGAIAAILLLYRFDVPCVILSLFNIPCISCGLTRAWLAAFRLDFQTAFAMHPMFWSIPILYLYILFDARLFNNKAVNWSVFGAVAAGFIINYIFVLLTL